VEETEEVEDVKDTETEKPAESSETKGDEVEGVPNVEDSKATEDVKVPLYHWLFLLWLAQHFPHLFAHFFATLQVEVKELP
jgi:hypothetical protein